MGFISVREGSCLLLGLEFSGALRHHEPTGNSWNQSPTVQVGHTSRHQYVHIFLCKDKSTFVLGGYVAK